MPKNAHCNGCGSVPGFSLGEKAFALSTFYGGAAVGAYGIWQASPVLALAYLAFVIGSFTLVVRYSICTRCPHVLEAGDCLFVPPSLVLKLIDRSCQGPLRPWQAAILYGAFGGTMLIPVWFLIPQKGLLGLFALLFVGLLVSFRVHYCKRCHVSVCPLNRREVT